MMRAIVGNAGVYVMTKGVVAVRFLGLFFSASVRGRKSEARCIVLTAIGKTVFKFISTSYVTVLVRANAAKEKWKGV